MLKTPRRFTYFEVDGEVRDYEIDKMVLSTMIEVKEEEVSEKEDRQSSLSSSLGELTLEDKEIFGREIVNNRILEKITDKVVDPVTTEIKKELLIRIALVLEEIYDEDMSEVEDLVDNFNKNDQKTRDRIVELFANKY